MLLQPLSDLQQEINRLMIAGSRFAHDDPRLQKLLPIFEKMGEKVPVFQKIAGNIGALLKAPSTESAEQLATLSTLLYAVLYTQGKNIAEGDIEKPSPLMNIDDVKTPLTYLELQPTIEALTTTGSGRYEIITDAFSRGLIHDVRLYSYIARGIEDKYSEIADFVKSDIIPAIDAPLIPFLLQDFELIDNKANAERINLLDDLGYSLSETMIQEIMEGKYPKLQVALIPSLSRDEQHLPLLLLMAKDKKKATKEAAFIGLARMHNDEAWDFLIETFQKSKSLAAVKLFSESLQYSNHLHHSEAIFFESISELIKELSTFSWQEHQKQAADLFTMLIAHLQIFHHKNYTPLIELLCQFSEQLNAHDAQKNGKPNDPTFREFVQQFDLLQIEIALHFGHLHLEEKDPLFTKTIEAIYIQEPYAIGIFLNHFYSGRYSPAFMFRAVTKLLTPEDLLQYHNNIHFLIKKMGPSPFVNEMYNHFYILYSDSITAPDLRYADPRWADYLYDYCATKEFLVVLRSAYSKRGYNNHKAMNLLAILNGLEPKDSPRMSQLLQDIIPFIAYDKIGPFFTYLEERMGNTAHPIILKRIDEDLKTLEGKTEMAVEQLNLLKHNILKRQG